MIEFHPATRTFYLALHTSYYAFYVDDDGRVLHLGWGVSPNPQSKIQNPKLAESYLSLSSFDFQLLPQEILTFGDVTSTRESLKVSFGQLGQPLAEGEVAHLPVRDVRLRYAGHEVSETAVPGLAPTHGLPTAVTTPRQTLLVHLQDPLYPTFRATLHYRLTPEHDVLERWVTLENHGEEPVAIETCAFASLHLPHGTTQLTSLAGAWAREFTTERTILTHGAHITESRTLQTGHAANPVWLLNRPHQAWEESGTVYFAALAYSGSWQTAVEHLPHGAIRLHAGYNPFDFALTLAAGEQHTTPALVCGVSGNGWGGASRRLHAFTCERILPAPQTRPVLYNSWEATYFNVTVQNQIALARKAAELGVELFCVDDGWFGGRRHDRAGLGDWFVSPEAFPEGLRPLVDEIHSLGMKFGLWVEPEMVNADSDLYRAHPEWVLHFPGRPRTEARNQLILDFGRPEVVEHIFGLLDALVREYDIAFFKWDMNRNASEPGSVAGRGIWRAHVAGVYGVMDRLRRNHPNLDIQSCSGGGGRIDLGILGRVDQVWTSDNTDAFDRIRIQEGFSLGYPARAMEAWVTHEQNHITQRVAPLSLRFDVAMRGVLGIGSSLNELSAAELEQYASYIAFYKQFRHVVQNGHLYRLERLEEWGASAVQYVLPNGREAVFSLALRDYQVGHFRPRPILRGLNGEGVYTAVNRHGAEVLRATGYELMTLGIPREPYEHVGYSRTLYLRQE